MWIACPQSVGNKHLSYPNRTAPVIIGCQILHFLSIEDELLNQKRLKTRTVSHPYESSEISEELIENEVYNFDLFTLLLQSLPIIKVAAFA